MSFDLWTFAENSSLLQLRFNRAFQFSSSTVSVAQRSELERLGSATVPVAAWRVSRHAFSLISDHRFSKSTAARDVFDGTPNTAGEQSEQQKSGLLGGLPALPGMAINGAVPLKTSKKPISGRPEGRYLAR
jgi:hypothetical protein